MIAEGTVVAHQYNSKRIVIGCLKKENDQEHACQMQKLQRLAGLISNLSRLSS